MALIKWDYEGCLTPDWWVEKVAKMEPDPYEEEECCDDCEEEEYEEEEYEEEYEEEEEEKHQKTLEELLREYNNREVENPWYEVRGEEQCEEEEEDDEIKGHIESFIEAFKVPRNKRKRVREILKKKNSERTQEEKDFLKELINRTKKIEVPKIQIVRQDENDDEGEEEESEDEEISADEIEKELEAEYEKQLDEELRRHRSIESLKSQIYEYRDKITDTRGWGDLDDPSAEVSYDWSSVAYLKEMEDFLKKFEK